jgi:hypothetical protein
MPNLVFSFIGRPNFRESTRRYLMAAVRANRVKPQARGNMTVLTFGSALQVSRIYHLLYDGVTVYLPRKRDTVASHVRSTRADLSEAAKRNAYVGQAALRARKTASSTLAQRPAPQAGQGLSPALTPFASSTQETVENPACGCIPYYLPDEHSSEEVRSGHAETDESKGGYSAFGNALMRLVLALFLFAAASYFSIGTVVGSFLGDSVGSIVGISISALCYVGALVFAFCTASFVLSGFDEHPELGPYLRHLFGGSADAWDSAFGALTFATIALIVHLVGIVAFAVPGVFAVLIKAFVYFFGFMGFVLGVSALDSLIFKPFLHNLSDPPDKRALSNRDKKIGVAVGSVVVSLATLLAALNELMN